MIAAHASCFTVCVRHRIRLTGSSATFYFVFDSYFVFRLMFAVRWCRLRPVFQTFPFPHQPTYSSRSFRTEDSQQNERAQDTASGKFERRGAISGARAFATIENSLRQ